MSVFVITPGACQESPGAADCNRVGSILEPEPELARVLVRDPFLAIPGDRVLVVGCSSAESGVVIGS